MGAFLDGTYISDYSMGFTKSQRKLLTGEEQKEGESIKTAKTSRFPNSKNYLDVIPQHIWYNEESHMASPNIDLVKMRNTAIASRDSNVFKLDVHVVFGYLRGTQLSS